MPSPTRHDILRSYHLRLSPFRWGHELRAESKAFKAENKVGEDHPLFGALDEIFGAHDRRAGGLSSPAECDSKTKEVIERG